MSGTVFVTWGGLACAAIGDLALGSVFLAIVIGLIRDVKYPVLEYLIPDA